MKGKALRRALATTDALRINADVPLLVDTTEMITPEIAQAMLRKNKANRPINWKKVEEYADAMERGEWELHAQGIILDTADNILTGQKRLWAVVYSGTPVYMRVSRGNPPRTARLIDRGSPQTARDLATRVTGRKHAPSEVSIARGYCALMGNLKPSTDLLAESVEINTRVVEELLSETRGTKKTRAVLMILSAAVLVALDKESRLSIVQQIDRLATQLEASLSPQSSESCWGRGAAFSLALERAKLIVQNVVDRVKRIA